MLYGAQRRTARSAAWAIDWSTALAPPRMIRGSVLSEPFGFRRMSSTGRTTPCAAPGGAE